LFIQAEADGRLDAVQNQLFDFSRTVAANGDLQLALSNPAVPGDQRSAVVGSLVEGRVEPETLVLLKDSVSNPRGRRLDDALNELVELAAVRRRELLAQVRAAIELSSEQSERLSAVLSRIYGQPVQIQQIIDPTVVGGVSVTINDEVIDGTTVHRLEQARRLLVGGQA
jgi:F-type H+-transporting ATPase subunit delta